MAGNDSGSSSKPTDEAIELIRRRLTEADERRRRSYGTPIITPLKGTCIGTEFSPKLISEDEAELWLRKDLWTRHETAFLLCGYLPSDAIWAPGVKELRKVIDDIERAWHAGNLRAWTYKGDMRPTDVIAWADAIRFPRFPYKNSAGAAQTLGVIRTGQEATQPGCELPRKRRQISEQNDELVLRAIRATNFDPDALPAPNGKPGAKAAARKLCSLTVSQFDTSWERLRAAGMITYKAQPSP